MKNIFKYILIFVIGGLFLAGCEWPENNFNEMYNDYDAGNTTAYVQLTTASGYWETSIDPNGDPENINITLGVVLLGAPQASDITATLVKNDASTLADAAWNLPVNSVTIPAGATSGSASFTLTAIAANMTEDVTDTLVLDLEVAGGKPATAAGQAILALKRIKFCALDDLNDLAGPYSGGDNYGYGTKVVTKVEDGKFMISGLGYNWMQDYWGETVLDNAFVEVTMNPDGTLDIPRQYCFTTDWEGNEYRYEVVGSGKWDNCYKTLVIEYDLAYEGDVTICEYYGTHHCGYVESITLIQ